MKTFARLACLLLFPLALAAHDTWLVPVSFRAALGQPATLRFATSEAFPTSEAPLALDRLARLTIRAEGGLPQPILNYRQDGTFMVTQVTPRVAGHAVVVAETKPRLLVLPAREFNDYIGHEELRHVRRARVAAGKGNTPGREMYRKIAKTVLCVDDVSGDATYAQPEGSWLEILPERSPCGVEAGDAITVRILFQGKPLAGAKVAAGYEGVTGHSYPLWVTTDKNGRAILRFDRPGAWFIRVLHMVALRGDPQADWQSAFATLTLGVEPAAVSGAAAEIRRVLNEQDAAWNRGDIEAFVSYYWKSGGLTFAGSNGVTRGWDGLLARYRRSYPDKAAMGRLSFSNLEIHLLEPESALVLGRWRLDRQKDTPGGTFSLVLRRFPEGWRIVHDHTSSDD